MRFFRDEQTTIIYTPRVCVDWYPRWGLTWGTKKHRYADSSLREYRVIHLGLVTITIFAKRSK